MIASNKGDPMVEVGIEMASYYRLEPTNKEADPYMKLGKLLFLVAKP